MDVCIHLNGGDDFVFVGETNTLEIRLENDETAGSIDLPFEIYWHDSVSVAWNMSYGDYPPVQDHGRAVGAWDKTGPLIIHDFDNTSPDHLMVSGVALTGGLPAGPSELCYSLEFDVTAPADATADGFCVMPWHYPPSGLWVYYDMSGDPYAPRFCGTPVSDPYDPVAPPACFDIGVTEEDVHSDADCSGDLI